MIWKTFHSGGITQNAYNKQKIMISVTAFDAA